MIFMMTFPEQKCVIIKDVANYLRLKEAKNSQLQKIKLIKNLNYLVHNWMNVYDSNKLLKEIIICLMNLILNTFY